jgi:hypothetical protein
MIPENFAPARINVVNIVALARASSYFFQGLLDGHPAIVTLPHHGYPSEDDIRGSALDIAKRAHARCVNWLFVERLPTQVPFAVFRRPFLAYLKEHGISRKTVFIATHYAFATWRCDDIRKVRYIAFQGHLMKDCFPLFADFPDTRTIALVRDPRAAYLSQRARNPYYSPLFWLRVTCAGYWYASAYPYQEQMLYVRHEDLHRAHPLVRRRYRAFLSLSDHPALDESTFYGFPYTGKSLGVGSSIGVFSSRPDPAYVSDSWKKQISCQELAIVNFLSRAYIKKFRYPRWKACVHRVVFREDFAAYFTSLLAMPALPHKGYYRALRVVARAPIIGSPALRCYYSCYYAGMLCKDFAVYLWSARVLRGFNRRASRSRSS